MTHGFVINDHCCMVAVKNGTEIFIQTTKENMHILSVVSVGLLIKNSNLILKKNLFNILMHIIKLL